MSSYNAGAVFEVKTPAGCAYVQLIKSIPNRSELIRVLPGIYAERPKDIRSLVGKRELFFLLFPISTAARLRKARIIHFVEHNQLPANLVLPEQMREKTKKGWAVVDIATLERVSVTELTDEQKHLSPWGTPTQLALAAKLGAGWNLENWGTPNEPDWQASLPPSKTGDFR